MYTLVSYEKIIAFFSKFGLDISLLTTYQTSVLILLSNIFMVIFYIFIFYVVYKLIHKILSWWF